MVEDVTEAGEEIIESTGEVIADAAEATQDTVETVVENVTEAVNDGIAEITSDEILEGEPPIDNGAALSTGQSVDLGQQLQQAFNNVGTALGSITDVTSAEAALPTLESATTSITSVATLAKFLSADARAALANFSEASNEGIQDALSAANGIEGVSDILTPSLEGLTSAITQLTQ